jgi:hypothetical protein
MDVMKLRQALAALNAFVSSLPRGDTAERYVHYYHQILNDIQNEMKRDLTYFHIPEKELEHRTVSVEFPSSQIYTYSNERFCARERFLMGLKGAVTFINSLTLDYGATTLPLIEARLPDPPEHLE